MKIFWKDYTLDVPLNLWYLSTLNFVNDKFQCCSIGYDDIDFHSKIEIICFDIALENEWVYHDKDNVTTDLLFDIAKDGNPLNKLCIQVRPPVYTQSEMERLLNDSCRKFVFTNSEDEFESKWSEYLKWKIIFAEAEQYYRSPGDYEDTDFCPVEFSEQERSVLASMCVNQLKTTI